MTATARRRPGTAGVVLVLALLALAATVAARPPHAPPLYDGLGFPDEPYRWVVAPAGSAQTASATAATVTVHVAGGTTAAAQALSAEQGPQVAVAVESGTFSAAGADITLRAQPRAVPATPPDGGQVVSNLYDLTATAAGRPVALAPGRTVLVNLRADSATDQQVVICRWSGHGWEQVPTEQVGADVYASRLSALGPVAVVRLDRGVRPTVSAIAKGSSTSGSGAAPVAGAVGAPGSASSAAPGAGPGGTVLLLVLGGVVVLLAAALLLVRRRSAAAGPGSPGTPSAQDGDPA